MNSVGGDPLKEGKYLFWIGVALIMISPLLIYIPAFGLLFVISLITFGFVLVALAHNIWKESVRHYRYLPKIGPAIPVSKDKTNKKLILIGLGLVALGPPFCYFIYFYVAGSFSLIMACIVMLFIGTSLVFFGVSSLERNALFKYNIPEHHFLWDEKARIRRKTIEIAFSLIFIYLIIFFAFIVPWIIRYNEFWAEGQSGARSPFGSGGECCSIILIIVFIVLFVILRISLLYKLKRDYIKKFEEYHKIR
jgi:hypothetical protein